MDNSLNVYYQQANCTNSLKNEPCNAAFHEMIEFLEKAQYTMNR